MKAQIEYRNIRLSLNILLPQHPLRGLYHHPKVLNYLF
jgi:hypothetical protein